MIRTLIRANEVFDFSPVTFPAYPDATVAKRSLDKYLEGKEKPPKKVEEVKSKKVETKSKVNSTNMMDIIKQLEDERQLLMDDNEAVLANLQDGKGNARPFNEEEREAVDANEARIDQIEHELETRKRAEARKAKDKEDRETKKRRPRRGSLPAITRRERR
jgi:hypothetical protein